MYIFRSGVEEAYTEKDRLLEEVSSLCKETNYSFKQPRKRTGLSKEQQLCELGKKARNKFAADFHTLEEENETNNSELTSELHENPPVGDNDYCKLKFFNFTTYIYIVCKRCPKFNGFGKFYKGVIEVLLEEISNCFLRVCNK